MYIERIRVKNLRAVKDCTMTLKNLTALVGPNGAGKSTLLHALMLFYGHRSARKDDYYNRDTSQDIKIQISFSLTNSDKTPFLKYTSGGTLTIVRIIHWKDGKATSTLHRSYLGNHDFMSILNIRDARSAKSHYAVLLKKPKYKNFPKWTTYTKARSYLLEWEQKNPCRYDLHYDDEEFFGDSEAGTALLSAYMRLIYIPAACDAAAAAGRGGDGTSMLGDLLDDAVQSSIARKTKFQDAKAGIKALHDAIMGGKGLSELDKFRTDAGMTLSRFVRGSGLGFEWIPPDPAVGLPRAEPYLEEDDYTSPVDMAGHGLQRALVMAAALHQLPPPAQADGAPAGGPRRGPSLVLAIEEPEIYQHPTRMRHFASLLRALSEDGLDGVASQIQVIYSTHSPHFVFVDRIDQIRLVSKASRGGRKDRKPMTTRIASTTSADILADMQQCNAASASDKSIDYSLLRAIGPAASEGFFADAVVLTEGQSDRIALLETAKIMGHSFDALGVSVISCESKSAIPLPLVMFRRLGVPIYAVWDADKNDEMQRMESERILSVLGHSGGSWYGKITSSFACLPGDLEDTIRSDLKRALGPDAGGDPYNNILNKQRKKHNLGQIGSKPLKTRLIMEEIGEKCIHLERLESIVGEIVNLSGGSAPK